MHTAGQKLKSNNGASMIITLVLFLICAMVSSIIIVAAASGSSRNVHRVEQQQAYLAVSSAARMLEAELKNIGTCKGIQQETSFGCNKYAGADNYTEETPYEDEQNPILGYRIYDFWIANTLDAILVDTVPCQANKVTSEVDGSGVTGRFRNVIVAATDAIYSGETTYIENFTIALTEEEERLPEVLGQFQMDASYGITIVLTTAESEYTITITMDGFKQDGTTTTSTKEQGCQHHVYYKRLLDNRAYETVHEDMWLTATVTSTTNIISWEAPIVEKGGATYVE